MENMRLGRLKLFFSSDIYVNALHYIFSDYIPCLLKRLILNTLIFNMVYYISNLKLCTDVFYISFIVILKGTILFVEEKDKLRFICPFLTSIIVFKKWHQSKKATLFLTIHDVSLKPAIWECTLHMESLYCYFHKLSN